VGRVRACVYDRTNVSLSDSVTGKHTGAAAVRELHTLLSTAGIAGPYLLVGASWGSLLAIISEIELLLATV